MTIRYQTIGKFASETGYTEQAVRDKLRNGVWLEGEVWLKAPDGRILIDVEGYYKWVEEAKAGEGRRKRPTRSPSPIAGSAAANESRSNPRPLTTAA